MLDMAFVFLEEWAIDNGQLTIDNGQGTIDNGRLGIWRI